MQFDTAPSEVQLGTAFSVTVGGIPGTPEDHEGLCVVLRVEDASGADLVDAGVVDLDADAVPIDDGSAYFDGIALRAAGGAAAPPSVVFVAALKDFDDDVKGEIRSTATPVVGTAGDTNAPDRIEVPDDAGAAVFLQGAVAAASRVDVMGARHCLQLLKSRMWGAADNDAVLAAAGAPAAVVNASVTLLRAAEAGGLPVATAADVVMDATAVIVEMLDNPSGRAVLSCAGCRAVAGATTTHMVRIGGEAGPIFHPGCAVCGKCKQPLMATSSGDEWCLRDPVTRQPCHTSCGEGSSSSGERTHVESIATRTPVGDMGALCRQLDSAASAEAIRALREVLVSSGIARDSFVRDRWEKLQRRATSVGLPSLRAALAEL